MTDPTTTPDLTFKQAYYYLVQCDGYEDVSEPITDKDEAISIFEKTITTRHPETESIKLELHSWRNGFSEVVEEINFKNI